MTTTAKPILFLAFANDRDDRARYPRNLAEEALQVQRALPRLYTPTHPRHAAKAITALTTMPNCAILDSQHTPWLPRNDAVIPSRSFPRWVARSAAAPDVWSFDSQAHRIDN